MSPRVDAVQLGRKIRILRESVASSRYEFARRLGHLNSASYLFQVERGNRIPAISYCEKIAKAGGVPLRDLIDARVSITLPPDEFINEAAPLIRFVTRSGRATILEVLRMLAEERPRRRRR
jgi:transcriptional regulator with XRE-family HTH domain